MLNLAAFVALAHAPEETVDTEHKEQYQQNAKQAIPSFPSRGDPALAATAPITLRGRFQDR